MMRKEMWEADDELPYLYSKVSEDENSRRIIKKNENEPYAIRFNDLTSQEFPQYVRRLGIPLYQQNRLISSIDVRVENPRFDLQRANDLVILSVEVENEYVQSRFTLHLENDELYLLPSSDYHDRLESMPWFKSETRRIEREINKKFYSCNCGFKGSFDENTLTVKNEFMVTVLFGDGDFSSEYPEYKVDFSKRKLEFYHLTDGHEIFGWMI